LKKSLVLLLLSFQLFASNPIIIDVRTPQEFESGHVESAINIEWQDIALVENSTNKDNRIFLYCRSGNRSQKATDILIDIGYKDVINLGSVKEASEFLNKKITR
jgi:phage shock protein E|tara:strand:- start:183 stop:494 length:312 start_codon:yes stop_codon:yes gene_type:complete